MTAFIRSFLCLAAGFAVLHAPARDIYLLIGQSNMAGRGRLEGITPLAADRIVKFTRDGQWTEAREPIHFDRPTTGAGPGLAFARALADADPSVEIGLVPCAEGGSPLRRWEPGGDLYTNALARARAALATGGTLRGILWHQGEADSWQKANAESYTVRLTNMVAHLRADLKARYVPFLAGEVGAFYGTSIEKRGGTSFVATVNAQIRQAVAALPAAGWVSVAGLEPGPDGIHFTTASAYELGRRYAAEMRRWQAVPNQDLSQATYGGEAARWKPAFTARGFNLQGMRMAGPSARFDERHFKWIKDWGFNFVRLPLDYRCWVKGRTSENREQIDESGLLPLDRGLAAARRNGLVSMVCLHRIPGEYCVTKVQPEPGNIYTDPDCLRAAVAHWRLLARRYRDIPREELFFNLINEPAARLGTQEQYEYVCRVLIEAIRQEDPARFIVADGWATSTIPMKGLYDVPGVGQATRGYYPSEFSHFGMEGGTPISADRPAAYPPVWPIRAGKPDGRLGGPRWADWHAPFSISNAPAGTYALALSMVSGPVEITVVADGKTVNAFKLEPRENDPSWSDLSRYKGTGPLRGKPTDALTFTLAQPARRLALSVTRGDWAMPRLLLLTGTDGRTARLDFSGNMKTMRNVAWNRRFTGWDAAAPLPSTDPLSLAQGRYGDDGMDLIDAGFLHLWDEPVAKGIWCVVGEFGCANHVAHADALRFLESNLKLFRVRNLGWCAWGFIGSRFGILNSHRSDVAYEDWQGEKLDRAMLDVLRRFARPDTTARVTTPLTVSPVCPRYFAAEGKTFIPVGINLCYARTDDSAASYRDWLDKFAANGGNYLRLWCGDAHWDVMPRFGEIDSAVCARLKEMADACNVRGIRLKLTLEQFRGFDEQQPPVFRKTIYAPYVKTMAQWFTNETCQAAFRKKIDAMAEAVADNPAVAVVEIWNEIMNDGNAGMTRWQTETLAYMRTRFPRQLVVANLGSFSDMTSGSSYDRICARNDNDFLQVHRYYDPGAAMDICKGPVDIFCADAIRELRDRRLDRPALLAEVGAVKPNHTGPSELYAKDPDGVLMHDMLFAPFFAGGAGAGQLWHWDNRYVDGNGLWHHFGRFTAATVGLDPAAEDFRPFHAESAAYRLYGLRGRETTVLWLRDKRVDALAEVRDGKTAPLNQDWKVLLRTGGPVDCYLPWEDRHVEAPVVEGKICLPPFRRSLVLRFRTPKNW